jgi:nucleotide-binding universal stress UspA family protein
MATDSTRGKVTTPLFNRILCPIEFGGNSLAALRLGRRLAERNGAALSVIHVMTPGVPGGVVFRDDREQARVGLEKMAESELDGIDYEVIVCWGNPAKEIVAAETRLGVELCVIPTDGRMGASHLFRKSIAEKVMQDSLCPVLLVGPKAAQPPDRVTSPAVRREPMESADRARLQCATSQGVRDLRGGFLSDC